MSSTVHLPRVLRHRDFRLLWLANSASVVGDRIVMVALALFVIELTGSATDLGLVLAAYGLPFVALLLVGGVVADRLERHRLAVATDIVRCALHSTLAVLILTGEVRIWHLVAIGVVFGSAEAFYRPAVTALLPQTVPEDEIQDANAVTMMFENVALVAGPALATALVLGLSPAAAFGLDAATFLVSALLLVRVRPRARGEAAPAADRAPQGAASSMRADLRAGYAEVRSRVWVWASLATLCVALFFVLAPLFVVGPVVAKERYGDIAVFGYLCVAFGAGTIAGSIAGLRWRPRYPLRCGMTFTLAWPAAIALFAAGAPLELVLPAMAIAGTGGALFDVWWVTALAERIPPDKLSRVTSYDWAASLGLMPLGYVLAGPAAGALGATTVLFGGAIVAILALALGLVPRETRQLARGDVAPAAAPLAEARPRSALAGRSPAGRARRLRAGGGRPCGRAGYGWSTATWSVSPARQARTARPARSRASSGELTGPAATGSSAPAPRRIDSAPRSSSGCTVLRSSAVTSRPSCVTTAVSARASVAIVTGAAKAPPAGAVDARASSGGES